MRRLATTRPSSKGQVVIPEEIRTALGLGPGGRFVVLSEGDVVILKRIDVPAYSEVRALAAEVHWQARKLNRGTSSATPMRESIGKASSGVIGRWRDRGDARGDLRGDGAGD